MDERAEGPGTETWPKDGQQHAILWQSAWPDSTANFVEAATNEGDLSDLQIMRLCFKGVPATASPFLPSEFQAGFRAIFSSVFGRSNFLPVSKTWKVARRATGLRKFGKIEHRYALVCGYTTRGILFPLSSSFFFFFCSLSWWENSLGRMSLGWYSVGGFRGIYTRCSEDKLIALLFEP